MRIAIHHTKGSYSDRWIEYCKEKAIDYKIVNCYDNNIISQLKDCDALMWHHDQNDYRDLLFAKQLLFSLQQSGKVVFPDFYTGWHFDDKVGQKYLFESLGLRSSPTYVFYNRKDAIRWANDAVYPKVFKLRGGAHGEHVRMVRSKKYAIRLINKAFGRGFSQINSWGNFKDRIKFFRKGKENLWDLTRGFLRLFIPKELERKRSAEKSYVYFQDFIPNEGFDYRIEICGDYCIAMIRKTRENDFRASGGHDDHFDKENITRDVITFAFDVSDKMKSQACALDIVRHKETGELYLLENSYCYGLDADEFSHGYWDRNWKWYDNKFDGRDWMVESVIRSVQKNIRGQ